MNKNHRQSRFQIDSNSSISQKQNQKQQPSNSNQSNMDEQASGSGSFDLNEDNIYQVEAILDKRIIKGKPEYLIKWKDWNLPQHNTWQNMTNLKGVKNLVEKFQFELKQKKLQSSKPIRKAQKKSYTQKVIKQKKNQKIKQKQKLKLGLTYEYQSYQIIQQNSQEQRQLKRKQSQLRKKKESQRQKSKDIQKKRKKDMSQSSQQDEVPISTQIPSNLSSNRQKTQQYKSFSQKPQIKKIPSQTSLKSDKEHSYQQKQIPKKKQLAAPIQITDKAAPKLNIGEINNYIIQNKLLSYQVNIVNEKGRTIGVRLMSSEELKKKQPQKLSYFLEQRLIDVDIYEQMIAKHFQSRSFIKEQQ